MTNSLHRSRDLFRVSAFLATFLVIVYASVVMFNQDPTLSSEAPVALQSEEASAAPTVTFKLTREECLSKNMAWNLGDNSCINFTDLRFCHQLDGEWIYPAKCKKH